VGSETFATTKIGDHRREVGPVKQVKLDEIPLQIDGIARACIQKISGNEQDEFHHAPAENHQPAAPPVGAYCAWCGRVGDRKKGQAIRASGSRFATTENARS